MRVDPSAGTELLLLLGAIALVGGLAGDLIRWMRDRRR